MIVVSRLNGTNFSVNADHIERIEEMPDTVLTLLDGKKILVKESLEEVIELIVRYRAQILHISYQPHEPKGEAPLRLVGGRPDSGAGEEDN